MSLIACPDCGAQISDRASSCIKCGFPLQAASPSPAASPPSLPPSPQRAQRSPWAVWWGLAPLLLIGNGLRSLDDDAGFGFMGIGFLVILVIWTVKMIRRRS
jgi:zinc-ribbon domain